MKTVADQFAEILAATGVKRIAAAFADDGPVLIDAARLFASPRPIFGAEHPNAA